VLGVGVGSLRPEFDLLGADFDGRGARADDALRALRASLSARVPAYHGTHYDFDGLVVDPCALQARVPLWVGGRTLRSLRRAVALADGWAPFGLSADALGGLLARVERPAGFEVVLTPERALDPGGRPEPTTEALATLAGIGTTVVNARLVARSLSHYLEQAEALMALGATTPGRS